MTVFLQPQHEDIAPLDSTTLLTRDQFEADRFVLHSFLYHSPTKKAMIPANAMISTIPVIAFPLSRSGPSLRLAERAAIPLTKPMLRTIPMAKRMASELSWLLSPLDPTRPMSMDNGTAYRLILAKLYAFGISEDMLETMG